MRRLIGLFGCCLMLLTMFSTTTYGQYVKIKGEAQTTGPVKSDPKPKIGIEESSLTTYQTGVPCEVQARGMSPADCACGENCQCGSCDCNRKNADYLTRKKTAAPDRLTEILNHVTLHNLPDGRVERKTLRQAVAEGAKIGPSTIYALGLTTAEIDAVYVTCRPRTVPDSYNTPVAYRVPVYEQPVYNVPIVYSVPVQTYQMPQVTYYQPKTTGGFQTGFQYAGPFGGQFGAGVCVGGS